MSEANTTLPITLTLCHKDNVAHIPFVNLKALIDKTFTTIANAKTAIKERQIQNDSLTSYHTKLLDLLDVHFTTKEIKRISPLEDIKIQTRILSSKLDKFESSARFFMRPNPTSEPSHDAPKI